MIDPRRLQSAIGVKVDGIFGPVSYAALFRRVGCSADLAAEFAIAAVIYFPEYGLMENIDRLSGFLGQAGHESDGWNAMEEYASGAAYEGRSDLGNTQPGDGKRFKGRGPFQLTGRANYREYGRALGIDLERHPEIAAIPSIGLRVACEYWKRKRLNELADRGDHRSITRRINGGFNGLDDRLRRVDRVKGLLA